MAKIIIADDDEIVGDMVCELLIRAGHTAGLLTNGRDALRVIKDRKPDLVILDCTMPEMGGIMVLREMRKVDALHRIPVLMLTGRRSTQDVELAHFAGANEYMKKPFDPDELLFRVETMLEQHAPEPPAFRSTRPSAGSQTGFGRLSR